MIVLREAEAVDAPALSEMIRDLGGAFVVDEAGAAAFWDSVSPAAERGYIGDPRYRYIVAADSAEIAGFISLRDGCHVHHFFVSRRYQGQGLGSRLWREALSLIEDNPAVRRCTVNSSLEARAVYGHYGFVPCGEVRRENGIAFVPMALELGRPSRMDA